MGKKSVKPLFCIYPETLVEEFGIDALNRIKATKALCDMCLRARIKKALGKDSRHELASIRASVMKLTKSSGVVSERPIEQVC
jgi:hypothetical protein